MGAGGRLVALDGGWAATDSEPRGQVSSLEAGRGRRATVRCKLSWVLAGRARWLDTLSEGTCDGPGPGGDRQGRRPSSGESGRCWLSQPALQHRGAWSPPAFSQAPQGCEGQGQKFGR